MDLGQRFDAICKVLDITYAELAKEIGIDRPDKFYHMRAGKSKLNFETIEAILKRYPQLNANYIFDTSTEILITDTEKTTIEAEPKTDLTDEEFLTAIRTLSKRILALEAELEETRRN